MRQMVDGRINFHDLGYRFIPQYWGKGYATEAAKATLGYGFDHLLLDQIAAMTDKRNHASDHMLRKLGLMRVGQHDWEGIPHHTYLITKKDWKKNIP